MHFVQLEETRGVVVIEILEHNLIHGELFEYFVQVDVIVRPSEDPLVVIMSVQVPEHSYDLSYQCSNFCKCAFP